MLTSLDQNSVLFFSCAQNMILSCRAFPAYSRVLNEKVKTFNSSFKEMSSKMDKVLNLQVEVILLSNASEYRKNWRTRLKTFFTLSKTTNFRPIQTEGVCR